jgi:hypothetical protein
MWRRSWELYLKSFVLASDASDVKYLEIRNFDTPKATNELGSFNYIER